MQARHLLAQPLDYIYHADFDKPGMEAVILAPMPAAAEFTSRRLSMKAPRATFRQSWPPATSTRCWTPSRSSTCSASSLPQAQGEQAPRGVAPRRGGLEVDPAGQDDDAGRSRVAPGAGQHVKEVLINANMRLVVRTSISATLDEADNFFELCPTAACP
ncbi:MAG: hypothetical protein U0797_22085 [Gemmataceae bacterium]